MATLWPGVSNNHTSHSAAALGMARKHFWGVLCHRDDARQFVSGQPSAENILPNLVVYERPN